MLMYLIHYHRYVSGWFYQQIGLYVEPVSWFCKRCIWFQFIVSEFAKKIILTSEIVHVHSMLSCKGKHHVTFRFIRNKYIFIWYTDLSKLKLICTSLLHQRFINFFSFFSHYKYLNCFQIKFMSFTEFDAVLINQCHTSDFCMKIIE